MIGLLLAVAWAGGTRVVLQEETVESIAAPLGGAPIAAAIRAANGLGPAEQPAVGTMLDLPEEVTDADCRPSYVASRHGEGSVRMPWGDEVPLDDLLPLPPGSEVCTGPEAFALLHLAEAVGDRDHDALTLLPGTCVVIRSSHVVGGRRNTHVELSQGTVAVGEEELSGHLVVQTRAGLTVAERGGLRVAVEEEATRTEAIGGVALAVAQGVQVDVPEGFGSRTRVGEAPGKPQPLPPAGVPTRPADGAELRIPDLAWTPGERALGYFVELSTSPGFDLLVLRARVGEPFWAPDWLLLPADRGGLWWRIVSFDAAGFQGAPGPMRRVRIPTPVLP